MYSISDEFKNQLKSHLRVEHVRGTIGTVHFDDTNVVSMNVSNRCSDTSDITFGQAYIGQLEVQFCNVGIERTQWSQKTITLEWGISIGGTTEWIPVGVFYVASAEWSDTGVSVIAYDVISKFEKNFNKAQLDANTVYGYALYACQQCGVSLGMTEAECEALTNGTQTLQLATSNDISTWRDFIGWLASTVGGFATADRDGNLVLRSFANSAVVDSWNTKPRIAGAVFSDYDTAYDGISITDAEEKAQMELLGDGALGYGNFINLGTNPFLQTSTTKEGLRAVLADVAASLTWTPFKASTLSWLVYDLGDLITCTQGVAGSSTLTCCIMSYDWTFKELTAYVGYGSDPSLSKGKTKAQKALSGVTSKDSGSAINFAYYVNSASYAISAGRQAEISRLVFGVTEDTEAEFWIEMKVKTVFGSSAKTVLKLHYWYDGVELVEYVPIETWGNLLSGYLSGDTAYFVSTSDDEYHTVNYHLHLPTVSNANTHTLIVNAEVESGEVDIATGDIHAVVWAQGMLDSDSFLGELNATDSVPFYLFDALELFGTMTDSAELGLSGGNGILTEAGENIITESGNTLITEEE